MIHKPAKKFFYKFIQIISLLIIFILFIQIPWATATSIPSILNDKIEDLLNKYHIPGASIAIANNGTIIWSKGFGMADIATRRLVNNTTLFQACSITKTLTSTAVLMLIAQKNISLDQPVNNYLKRWKIPENRFTQKRPITIRMLLNHTAPISNPYPDGGFSYDAAIPTLKKLFLGKKPAKNPPLTVTGVPGKKFSYCNGCYAILQMFMEDVTGESYSSLIKRLILHPISMNNSLFDNQLFPREQNKIALPYNTKGQRFKKAPTRSPIYATGWLWTDAQDLTKFAIAIQKSINSIHGLVPQALAISLVSPDSTPTRGLGFFIANKNGDEYKHGHYFMHTGNNVGYLTLLIGSIDGKNTAAFMINSSPNWNAEHFPQFAFIKQTLQLINTYYKWE